MPDNLNGTHRGGSIADLIGNTPVVEIRHLNTNPGVKIYAKLEGMNPGNSVKDRVAKSMIEAAERDGELGPGTDRIIFEPTSGNTGVGIAMIAAERGYEFIAVISEGMTIERRQTMVLLGAKFIVTEGSKGTNWAIEKAYEMVAETPQYLLLDQFNNPANTEAHYTTTGPEILRDVPEITHFVGGMGTGGTLMGVHQFMKEHKPDTKIIGLEPMIGTKIQGLRKMEGFIPGIYHEDRLDEKIALDDEEVLRVTRELGTREGIFAGISSGAAMWGALQVAAQLDEGTIVVVLPDYGERYLSSPLFDVDVGSILPEIL